MTDPLRILIVEDSEDDAELVLMELRRGGYEIAHRRVETASEMHDALAQEPWDVVLSDFSLPGFSAPAALRVLRESGVDTPCLIVSGTIGEEAAVAALHAGASDFLLKGNLIRLVPAVERELRESKVRQARRSAEMALRETEERYRRIIETTNEGVWMIDTESRTTFVNARLASMLGWTAAEITGKPIDNFIHDDSLVAISENLARREAGAARQAEVRLKRQDGAELWVLLDSTPAFDGSGRYEGALAMVMDVTERKRLEEQLRQSQKMEAVGRLAGGIAHDFNNMLTPILSYASLMIADLEAGHAMRADLREIQKAAERATALVGQLLAFSRQKVVQLQPLDLNERVRSMEKMLRPLIGEHIELGVRLERKPAIVYADATEIEQVIMNLVLNARDAMPNGGKLSIETAHAELDEVHRGSAPTHGSHVMLIVSDTGIGMDAETQARIFEPFFTTKQQRKGTGLGLATVYAVVTKYQGSVRVFSEPERGTTFKIYLPRHLGKTAAVSGQYALAPSERGTETILLVEDDDAVRRTARVILRRQGYSVLEASSGSEALQISERHAGEIELLLTDVVMPGMGGRQLSERLAQARPQLRTLYMSGYTSDRALRQSILESSDAFVQKPFTPAALASRIREVLGAHDGPDRDRAEVDAARKGGG
jgi:two-component system, cell cycle sensor histidine kinase and response regulator CckA